MKTQLCLTVSQGKRLIAKGFLALPDVREKLKSAKVLIIAGTTNSYIAGELLESTGQSDGFDRGAYFRGVTVPYGAKVAGREFIGDVYLENGVWQRGKTVDEVADAMGNGDIILKGGNAVNIEQGRAAVLIGSNVGGTAVHAMKAVYGRRAKLYVPIGVEKRVMEPIEALESAMCAADAKGSRLMALPGQVYTELDAIKTLTGASARLVAAGGILDAEGCAYFLCEGDAAQIAAVEAVARDVRGEAPFAI